jgi:hypothetical protein
VFRNRKAGKVGRFPKEATRMAEKGEKWRICGDLQKDQKNFE